ncbi:MAG: hypothetical protein IIC21_01315, partial [Chloroflexi bacterium]|nr:hypothetical protein [Chloroflexota bacterium]
MFELNEIWKQDKMYIETVGFQKTIKTFLEKEMIRRGKHFIIEELKPDGKKKELRIMALQPLYSQRKMYHKRGLTDLEDQLLTFPHSKYDDLIDALAYHVDVIYEGETAAEEQEQRFGISIHDIMELDRAK